MNSIPTYRPVDNSTIIRLYVLIIVTSDVVLDEFLLAE